MTMIINVNKEECNTTMIINEREGECNSSKEHVGHSRCNPITEKPPCQNIGKVAQTDWRETDKNSPAYLKNRPESIVESIGGLKAGVDGDIPIADLEEHIASKVNGDIKEIEDNFDDLSGRVQQLEDYHDEGLVTKEQLLIAWDFL